MSDEPKRQQAPWWAPYATVIAVAAIGGYVYLEGPGAPQPTPPTPGGTLRDLVPEASARKQLATFYREAAVAVADPKFPLTDTVQVASALRLAAGHYQSLERLPPMSQLSGPIKRKLEYAIGKENRKLDAETKTELATVLNQIANDFGG